jgi:hypothetical protein
MINRDKSGGLIRAYTSASGHEEATNKGAWIGWITLAAPTAWMFYETTDVRGLCRFGDNVGTAMVASVFAVALFGVWIACLRRDRDRRQDKLDEVQDKLDKLLAATEG